jgi:hypothetical protein
MDIKNFLKINDRDIRLLTMLGKGIKSTKMAGICGIIQPRISLRLSDLEHELGPILNLDCENKRSYRSSLTENGVRVVAIAEQIDKLFCELRQHRLFGMPDKETDQDITQAMVNDLRALATRLEKL